MCMSLPKIKAFNAYTLSKVHQLGGIARHTWYIVWVATEGLRTIANKLIRELQRKLSTHSLFETYQKDFLFYQKVLAQQPKDKNNKHPI
jgi:hypothetical protein